MGSLKPYAWIAHRQGYRLGECLHEEGDRTEMWLASMQKHPGVHIQAFFSVTEYLRKRDELKAMQS